MAFNEPDDGQTPTTGSESLWGFINNLIGRLQASGEQPLLDETSEQQVAEWMSLVKLLQDIAVAANEATTVEAAMQFALDRVCDYTGWPVGHVYISDKGSTDEIVSADVWYLNNSERFETFQQVTQATRFTPGQVLPGRVFATGEPAWIKDVTQDPNFVRANLADIGVRSGFAFPVWVGQDVVAVLEFFSTETVKPEDTLLEVMTHVGIQLGRVIERKRAEEALQARELQLAEAQRLAHIGSWNWDIATNEVKWSDELYRIYGLTPQDFTESFEGFLEWVHPDDRNFVRKKIEEAYDSYEPFSFEHRIIRPDGTSCTLQTQGKVVRDQADRPIRMFGTEQDITERKQAEKALHESISMFEGLFEASPDATVLVNKAGRIVKINRQTEEMFGYTREELLNHPVEILLPTRFREQHAKHRADYYTDPRARPMGVGLDLYGCRKNGSKFPVDITLSPLQIGDTVLIISVVHDITRRKEMEADLAEVQHRLIESREAERLHIAQELHDGPLQDLHGVSYQLNELWDKWVNEANREGELITIQVTLQRVIKVLRAICGELRPPALAPFGLEKAIRSHAEHFQEKYPELSIQLDLMADGQTLPEQVRLALFRIYQQALNNIIKHADAEQITVRFELDTEQIILEIQDDGCGFVMPRQRVELARQGHLGLVGATERAEAIGGKLQIISVLGQGTLVQAVVPRSNENVDEAGYS